ncbi:MAG: argininosuccinate synthase [Desulfitibacter sp. BRH_c19]|nr:MAG: argininosuccinate synthase [Desulfitibacter sp. BRH_c19]
MKKVVLAYSGGLDTSVIIPWLKDNYGYEVVAMAADVGQGEELEHLHEKAINSGALKLYIEDLREEFITDYVYPCLKAGAVYEGKYLLGTSFARPLIAKRLVEIAKKEGAEAISHGATGKGNDQVRFELAVKALNPNLKIIAPWREWDLKSREDCIEYAKKRKIPLGVTKEKIYSRDRNLFHLSHEGGDLENPENEPKLTELLQIITPPELAPDKPTYIEIEFEEGIPVRIDGKALSPIELMDFVNQVAAINGVGICDMVENRLVGMKSRGVYETPGGTVLYYGHRELELITLDRQTFHYKELLAQRYSELVYDGVWFHPLREALDAFVNSTQKTVTGKVRLKLYKGNIMPAGSSSPYSLYDEDIVTFGESAVYDQNDATGFINLFGLSMKVKALMEEKSGLKK